MISEETTDKIQVLIDKTMSVMNNDTFIGYCESHSQTPRHLFHIRDIIRLHRLAEVEEDFDGSSGFYSMGYAYVKPLVNRYWQLKADREWYYEI